MITALIIAASVWALGTVLSLIVHGITYFDERGSKYAVPGAADEAARKFRTSHLWPLTLLRSILEIVRHREEDRDDV